MRIGVVHHQRERALRARRREALPRGPDRRLERRPEADQQPEPPADGLESLARLEAQRAQAGELRRDRGGAQEARASRPGRPEHDDLRALAVRRAPGHRLDPQELRLAAEELPERDAVRREALAFALEREAGRRRQRLDHVVGLRVPRARLAREQLRHHRLHARARPRRRRRVEVRAHDLGGRPRGERIAAAEQLVQRRAERVEIGRGRRRRAFEHLRRRVLETAARRRPAGEAEIDEQRPAAGEDRVLRLDVAVHDAAAVQVAERPRDPGDVADHHRLGRAAQRGQVLGAVLERQRRRPRAAPERERPREVRVDQRRARPVLGREPRRRPDLERHIPLGEEVDGEIDRRLRARPAQGEHPIAAADQLRHLDRRAMRVDGERLRLHGGGLRGCADFDSAIPAGKQPRVLRVRELSVRFQTARRSFAAVDGISFDLERGGSLALIGESGSGKTTTALSLLRLLPAQARASGRIELHGRDLLSLPEREMQKMRGAGIAMVFHDPLAALNPVFRIGTQVAEALRDRAGALRLLQAVGLDADAARRHPHELSGGMRQRALIAMAVACNPSVVVADEPTSALDARSQDGIVALLRKIRAERGTALLLATHDLPLAARLCDEIAVLYAGRIVERGPAGKLLERPRHPYTAALLRSIPAPGVARLQPVPGSPPSPWALPSGCRFRDRCPRALPDCALAAPSLEDGVACFHPEPA